VKQWNNKVLERALPAFQKSINPPIQSSLAA
jgi:hypothetical protein